MILRIYRIHPFLLITLKKIKIGNMLENKLQPLINEIPFSISFWCIFAVCQKYGKLECTYSIKRINNYKRSRKLTINKRPQLNFKTYQYRATGTFTLFCVRYTQERSKCVKKYYIINYVIRLTLSIHPWTTIISKFLKSESVFLP